MRNTKIFTMYNIILWNNNLNVDRFHHIELRNFNFYLTLFALCPSFTFSQFSKDTETDCAL